MVNYVTKRSGSHQHVINNTYIDLKQTKYTMCAACFVSEKHVAKLLVHT